jgi:hypothetical protein
VRCQTVLKPCDNSHLYKCNEITAVGKAIFKIERESITRSGGFKLPSFGTDHECFAVIGSSVLPAVCSVGYQARVCFESPLDALPSFLLTYNVQQYKICL